MKAIKKKGNRIKKKDRFIWPLFCLIWGFVCLFPIWILFSGTFSPDSQNLVNVLYPSSIRNGITKIYDAVTTVSIGRATIDTLVYSSFTVIGILLISSLAAYEFSFFRFPFKKFLFGLVMVSMMLPQILYIIPLYRMVYNMGLADTLLGISLPLMVAPLAVFIMMQFIEDLPPSFIESARIDGAGHFTIYWKIVLPLMRNGILTTAVLMFMKIWGQYLWPSLITANRIKPISVTIANILSPNYWVDSRVKIAAMLVAMLPPLLVYIFFQKHVIEGVTSSGVKG